MPQSKKKTRNRLGPFPPAKYYPAFLNLQRKKAVVVGGGKVAERKILTLLQSGAIIKVISPSLTPRLQKEKENKRILHLNRAYKSGDIKGAFLVIAATDSGSLNSKIASEATMLVNVVDVPSECNFIAPSVIQRGPLTIAMSTAGVSPAFAKTVRKELEKIYGSETGSYLKFVSSIRKKALVSINDKKVREKFLKNLGSSSMLQIVRKKGLKEAEKLIKMQFEKLKA